MRGGLTGAGARRRWWTRVRVVGGLAILTVVVWRLGSGPFVDGVRMIDGWSLAAAAGIAFLTTVFCAWRWTLVARGLGVGLSLRSAVAAYYRSQFLNTMLPGGVLGDVHRAVRHGHDVGDVGRSLRAVAAERLAGQVVQVGVATVVLLVLPSPVRSFMPLVALTLLLGVIGLVLAAQELPRGNSSRRARIVRTGFADLSSGLLARASWPGIVLASVLVVMGIPANVGGWGPREGVAAWVFAAAGFGAAQGVATAVVYGVMALVANLPGVVVLIAGRRRQAPLESSAAPLTALSAGPAAILTGMGGAARG